jgi:hypothetical protein
MKEEAPKYNAVIADAAAAWDAYPGGGSVLSWITTYLPQGKFEIHPNPQGYRVYGEAVIKASGYLPTVSARLVKKQVKSGKTEKVQGTTAVGADVQITVWLPGRQPQVLATKATGSGAFAKSFKVGKARGKGAARVCVSLLAGQAVCTGKMAYTIR